MGEKNIYMHEYILSYKRSSSISGSSQRLTLLHLVGKRDGEEGHYGKNKWASLEKTNRFLEEQVVHKKVGDNACSVRYK